MDENEINEKDKEFQLKIGNDDVYGSILIKNNSNRVIAKIGDIMLDSLSYFRWSNAVHFLDKYNKKKEKRGLVGKETPLPPKFIIEILSNAFQEDDELLLDNWNNLLINWQDLEEKCDKKYMYIDILKNLGINEIRFLKLISEDPDFDKTWNDEHVYYEKSVIKEALNLNDHDYELMTLNLYRLKVCDSYKTTGNVITVGSLPVRADAGIDRIRVTIIGYNLIKNIND